MKKLLFYTLILLPMFSICQTPGAGVTDIDGNNYTTVIIGTQEWMSENLRTSKYSNGDIIQNITDNLQWQNLSTGAWSNYNNDVLLENPYGKLYNWYCVSDIRNVCPTEWHIPTFTEWSDLTTYIGGIGFAGGKMKEIGTTHWLSPNNGATNQSGFTGLPGGSRGFDGVFGYLTTLGNMWSFTENDANTAWLYKLTYSLNGALQQSVVKEEGLSVRCLFGDPQLGIIELDKTEKQLVKIVDIMGREIPSAKNTVMIYLYNDGTSERVFEFE